MTSVIGFDKPMLMYYKKTTLNNQDMVQHCEFKKNSAGKLFKRSIKNSILISVLFLNTFVFGQSIFTNPITGTNPNSTNPYIIGQTVDVNITVSGIGRGAGIAGANANNRYNANGWSTGAIILTDYFEFTLTPTAGCDIDFVSFVYTGQSSAAIANLEFRSSLDGFAASIGTPTVGGTNIDLSGASYQNILSAITFRLYAFGAAAATTTFSINDFTFNGTTACGAPLNTITTGAISVSPFGVTCSTPATGSIAFTSSGTFIAGNNYVAQLSNASGSFASPTIIGSLTSAANSGSISISIPSATATGAGYLIRIISTTPAIISNSSAAFSINLTGGPCALTAPYMTSAIINSCNFTCQEGHNEIVFGSTGDFSVLGNTSNLILTYGNIPAPPTTYTDAFTTVPATTSAINSAAGCTVVQEGLGATMPPNSNFVIVRSTICVDALDWTSLCGSGTIYIFYSTDASWQTSGNFVNTPNGLRYFRTTITATDASVSTIDYSYNSDLLLNSDGEFVTYGTSGGTPLFYGDNNCILEPVLLPSDLVNFKGQIINSQSLLTWETSSEQNNDYFTITHSTTGYDFEVLGQLQGAGNSSTLNDYKLIHSRPSQGINYYKLTSTDFDGTTYSKGIVSLLFNSNGYYFNSQTSEIKFNQRSDYRIFSMDGKLLGEAINETSLLFNQQGIVLIQDLRTGLTERLFIP